MTAAHDCGSIDAIGTDTNTGEQFEDPTPPRLNSSAVSSVLCLNYITLSDIMAFLYFGLIVAGGD